MGIGRTDMHEIIDLTADVLSSFNRTKKLKEFQNKRKKNYIVDEPQDGKIKVTFIADDDSKYSCIYYYKTKKQVYSMIRSGQSLDLKYTYIKDFDIFDNLDCRDYTLKNFNASSSFLDGHVKFNGAHFEDGNVSFRDVRFGDNEVSFDYVQFGNCEVDFCDARFGDGEANFVGARFGDGDVNFFGAHFGNGDVNFAGAKFGNGDINFNHTKFANGIVNFWRAQFNNSYVSFLDAEFGDGYITFWESQFNHSDVSFWDARFGEGDVDFNDVLFDGNVVFGNTRFGKGKVFFSYTHFNKGDLIFNNASAQILIFESNTFSSHIDLRLKEIEELIVQDCIIEKTIKCHGSVSYKKLSLHNTVNLGQIYIYWDNNGVFDAISNGIKISRESDKNNLQFTIEEKASQFRMLKENFHNIGYYEDEDCAYKAYMDCKTESLNWFKEAFEKGKRKNLLKGICKGLGSVFKKLFYKAFGLISGYGTKPLRILGSAVISIILCGFAYSPFVSKTFSFMSIWRGLYFSTITFLTIGYENMKPLSEFPAILSGIEGFIGLFLMSFFTVAVARKLLR